MFIYLSIDIQSAHFQTWSSQLRDLKLDLEVIITSVNDLWNDKVKWKDNLRGGMQTGLYLQISYKIHQEAERQFEETSKHKT